MFKWFKKYNVDITYITNILQKIITILLIDTNVKFEFNNDVVYVMYEEHILLSINDNMMILAGIAYNMENKDILIIDYNTLNITEYKNKRLLILFNKIHKLLFLYIDYIILKNI